MFGKGLILTKESLVLSNLRKKPFDNIVGNWKMLETSIFSFSRIISVLSKKSWLTLYQIISRLNEPEKGAFSPFPTMFFTLLNRKIVTLATNNFIFCKCFQLDWIQKFVFRYKVNSLPNDKILD